MFNKQDANVNPANSNFLTSVPSSMRWERKERQCSPSCPCCVLPHWCCGRRHDILRLLRFLASTSFHQRGLAGNCLAESSQRLESKTWSSCVTEVTSYRPHPSFLHQLSVREGTPFITSSLHHFITSPLWTSPSTGLSHQASNISHWWCFIVDDKKQKDDTLKLNS